MQYSCKNFWSIQEKIDDNEVDPIADGTKRHGMTLQIFSDLISTGFWSEASILAFYVGTVMTIGALFRTIVMYKADRIFIVDARNPERIRALIAAIYRQRHEQNLKREEELYYLLFEILRNPQLFTHLTGTSLKGSDMNPEEYPERVNAGNTDRWRPTAAVAAAAANEEQKEDEQPPASKFTKRPVIASEQQPENVEMRMSNDTREPLLVPGQQTD